MNDQRFSKDSTEIMTFDFVESRHIAEHTHPDLEILYVLEGATTVKVGGSSYEMHVGDVMCILPGKVHSLHATESVFIGVLHVNYREFSKYVDTNRYYIRCNSVVDKNQGYQELRDLMDQIFHLYYERTQESLYLNSLYYAFLSTFVSHFAFRSDSLMNLNPQSAAELRTNDILNYIGSNYMYPLSLTDLAEHLDLTPAYLSKYIKKTLGKNFLEYLNDVRLTNAVQDMMQTDHSLSRISMDNGFPNTTAFSATFRKVYGENPSVWLARYREEHAEERSEGHEAVREEHIRSYLEQNKTTGTTQASRDDVIQVTCSSTGNTLLRRNWNRMINIGSCTALMRSDLQEQILLLHKELGFEYIRFWDLFTAEMFIDVTRTDGKYNFGRIDRILDFLVTNGLHPFIEMGFKPVMLTRTVDNERPTERPIPYQTYGDYQRILYAFLAHSVNRYGIDEVRTWYLELWGDPRVTSGPNYGTYFAYFETAYHAAKSISREIRIGGAGFGRLYSTLEFKEIIVLWQRRGCMPDFLSLYCYPYLARSNNESQNDDRLQDPNYINNQIMMMQEVMDETGFHPAELLVTEWSSSISNWNSLSDSMYKGAFILKTIFDNIGCTDMLGYWLASDILAEYYDTTTLLHGGGGLLSMDSIKKPAYYAFAFANQLGTTLLARHENAIVTKTAGGNYSIVCHHFVAPNFRYYLRSEDEIDVRKQFLLFDEEPIMFLRFRITDVENGRYLIKFRSLSSEHGSVQDEWAAMDYNTNLGAADIKYLRNISTPRITIIERTVTNHVLELETSLIPQEMQYIHLRYLIE